MSGPVYCCRVPDDAYPHDGLDISEVQEPDAADLGAVKAGVVAFNMQAVGTDTLVPLAVLARRGKTVLAGVSGFTLWGWLFVHYLWVSDELRGTGLGHQLMGRAEETAQKRGCRAVWLDTFSFQAPGFYEKLGYRQFGQLDDFPPGHTRRFLWKPLHTR